MLTTALLVKAGEVTNRTFVLPLAVFFPTNRCNSRCLSCDWWKSSGDDDLSLDEIDGVVAGLASLGTRLVLFSGGEPLLRPEVFDIAERFRRAGMALHLHTSGVLLERCAAKVVAHFERVIVSLDAPSEDDYRAVRGVGALRTLERGVALVRELAPRLPVSARSTLHRWNFRHLPSLVEHARAMSLDGISFLAADLGATAFGRPGHNSDTALALEREEIVEFADLVERTIVEKADAFADGFIAESPDRLRRLPQYYGALAGLAPFPPVSCHAPYVSVVIEADGSVRPCFFHRVVGSTRTTSLRDIVRRNLPEFREGLSVAQNPTCQRCVCSLNTSWRSAPWL